MQDISVRKDIQLMLLPGILLCAILAGGCSQSKPHSDVTYTKAQKLQQIEQSEAGVKNDPKLPDSAKQQVIAKLEADKQALQSK